MDFAGLQSVEILAAKAKRAETVAAYKILDKKIRKESKAIDSLEQAFWENNLESADLDNPETLMVVSDYGWARGSGNPLIAAKLSEWVASKGEFLSRFGWSGDSCDASTVMLPRVEISLPCELSDKQVTALSLAISGLSKTLTQISTEYKFHITENSHSQFGVYSFTTDGATMHITVLTYGRTSDQFVGTLEDGVRFISSNFPYCPCKKHSTGDDARF